MLYKPGTGDHAGQVFLVVDQDGVAGYGAGTDLVMQLLNGTHLAHLNAADFTT